MLPVRIAAIMLVLCGCAANGRGPSAPCHLDISAARRALPGPAEASEPETADLVPCVAATPEHDAAAAAIARASADVAALPASADAAPLARRVAALFEMPCLAVGGGGFEPERVDSALALQTYWNDGGEAALSARLEWAGAARGYYWAAPSIRTTLTRERAQPNHPLAPLLCPAADPTCGHETAGWRLRAANAFQTHARVAHEPKSCEEIARADAGAAFVAFADCIEANAIHEDALPLGTFRAPTDGWLVLRGRRGHHGFCNELRAYDLASGAAWIAKSCGGISTGSGVEQGRLPVEALREAALMMFLANVADHAVLVRGEGHAIPPEIAIRAPAGRDAGLSLGGIGLSSGRTTLVHQWIRNGKSIANGTVQWPDAYRAADEHAAELLAIAEAGLVSGCAPKAMPKIPWSARDDASTRLGSGDDYRPAYDEPDFLVLEEEIALKGKRGCTR